VHVRSARADEEFLLSRLVRDSYRDVARRFGLTPQNCSKHPSNCTKAWIRGDLARGVAYFIVEDGGAPCGCVALEKAGDGTCYLERLAVLPAYRRRGFGNALVEHVLGMARAMKAREVGIGIIAAQVELQAWYGRIGFLEGQTQSFPHLPFLVRFMTHRLG
jgi:ribosomal protein S18 acetylase RimI-like enzyme